MWANTEYLSIHWASIDSQHFIDLQTPPTFTLVPTHIRNGPHTLPQIYFSAVSLVPFLFFTFSPYRCGVYCCHRAWSHTIIQCIVRYHFARINFYAVCVFTLFVFVSVVLFQPYNVPHLSNIYLRICGISYFISIFHTPFIQAIVGAVAVKLVIFLLHFLRWFVHSFIYSFIQDLCMCVRAYVCLLTSLSYWHIIYCGRCYSVYVRFGLHHRES